ncbi:MAG: DUF1232 domain-containing protein [Bryobacterales bacterium]|nr:DUF1232 domain-containing protein [Bryobacterales bacterium]
MPDSAPVYRNGGSTVPRRPRIQGSEMELFGKLASVALGAGLLYAGVRLIMLAFRLWRLGVAARGIMAAVLGAIYTISPVDGVPDVIVGVGWMDDAIVLGMAAMYIWKLLGRRQTLRRRPVAVPQLPR